MLDKAYGGFAAGISSQGTAVKAITVIYRPDSTECHYKVNHCVLWHGHLSADTAAYKRLYRILPICPLTHSLNTDPHAHFVSPVYPRLHNPQDKQVFCFFFSYLLHLTGEIAGGLWLSIIERSRSKCRSCCCGFPTQHWHCLGELTTHKSPCFCTPSVAPGISCRDVFAGKPLARNRTWPNTSDQQRGTVWYKRMQKGLIKGVSLKGAPSQNTKVLMAFELVMGVWMVLYSSSSDCGVI